MKASQSTSGRPPASAAAELLPQSSTLIRRVAAFWTRYALVGVLAATLAHGLLYVFIVPPWQHYDEPNHFEYGWLLAHRGAFPQPGDFDLEMRLAVQRSMFAHEFFRGMSFQPDPNEAKPWIGDYSQLGDPPGYYLLAMLPVLLMRGGDVTVQLYAMRLVSLALFGLTVLAAWGVMRELTPPSSPFRWLIPLTAALLPAFADLMTAVNSDAGAVAAFSLFLWACVRLVRRRFSWLVMFWALAAAAACVIIKPNAAVAAAPVLGVTLLLAVMRGRWRWLAWAGLAAGVIAGLIAAFSWGDAALWYRHTSQPSPTRVQPPQAVVGSSAIGVEVFSGEACPQECKVIQLLPSETGQSLSGKTITLGGWIWATQPTTVRSPSLMVYDSRREYYTTVSVTETPAFYAFTFQVDGDPLRSWIILSPGLGAESVGITVFYDGLILAEGERPLDAPPVFDDPQGAAGEWGGQPFTNLLRNPSAESAWPRFRSWADSLGARVFPDRGRPSIVLYSLLDWPADWWQYWGTATGMLQTFWAKFGWGHVPLLGHKPYRLLAAVTLLAIPGALWALWRQRRSLPWDVLVILGLAAALIWGLAVTRGTFYIIYRLYFPVARYAYPAIIPTLLGLGVGWVTPLRGVAARLRAPDMIWQLIYVGLFLTLDVYALVSVLVFYSA